MSEYTTCEPFRSWCRLEPRPRAAEFDRVLKAEIHDALWMLTRQWQFGEFQGEDTGSAVFAKVKIETTRITKFQGPFGPVGPYDEGIPLEAKVEQMPVQYDIRFRARSGQYWLKLLQKKGQEYNNALPIETFDYHALKQVFVQVYPFSVPVIDRDSDSTKLQVAKAKLLINKGAHQALTALSGRTPDGVQWFEAITKGTAGTLPAEITGSVAYHPAFKTFILEVVEEYLDWFKNSHEIPENDNEKCWKPSHMEYSFACSLPNSGAEHNTLLNAEEYYMGHLDWYSFDINLKNDGTGLGALDIEDETENVKTEILSIIPSEARFGGMPNSRWWEFEDGATDFGNINAETTNLAKILLAEFALMYSNDWFVIPYTVPAGSVSEVKGIVVTDSFGEQTLIRAAGQGEANDWTAWTMFNLSKTADSDGYTGKMDPRIFMPPVVNTIQESKPLESVSMVRDEMANMVWGVESIIPDLLGGGADGSGAAQALTNYLNALERKDEKIPVEIPEGVKLKYQLGNAVPENWIPFLPTHLPDQNRAIQLQRASMPRWFNNEFSQIRPITSILREGMHQDESTSEQPFVNSQAENQVMPFFVFEEEVSRSGIVILFTWQRTRWYNGKIVCWYGGRKKSSRGEGASGLAFDKIIDVDYEHREALVKVEES